ncbi:MAG: hypothetical protein AAF990_01545 [Bacteroidota bacterium]
MQQPQLFYESLVELELLTFFGYWQILTGFFAFVALLGIWWHIGRKQKDFGQVWLALSVLCWSFSGSVEVYFANQTNQEVEVVQKALDAELANMDGARLEDGGFTAALDKLEARKAKQKTLLDGLRSILSLLNSLFILMALPTFRHIPKPIEFLLQSKAWFPFIFLAFLICFLAILSTFAAGPSHFTVVLDVIYALVPTLPFLGWILWESFDKRGLKILAWLSVLCIAFTTVAQLYKLYADDPILILMAAVFKTSLIMIFFALALSWVKELSEFVVPQPGHLYLYFDRHKSASGKVVHIIRLKGLPWPAELPLTLTRSPFNLLLKFAQHKQQEADGWLEIKPKKGSRNGKEYDIQDHNQLIRLLSSLLDEVARQQGGTSLDRKQLKEVLFESSPERERLIRLRIPPVNLHIPNALKDL